MPQGCGPLGGGDDHGAPVVGLHAKVEEAERIGDHRARVVIVYRERLAKPRVGIVRGHRPGVDGDVRHLVGRRAVEVHVAPHREGEHLSRGLQAVGHGEGKGPTDRGDSLTDLPEGLAVALGRLHRGDLVDHHVVRLVGRDRHRGVLECSAHRGPSPAPGLRRIPQPVDPKGGHQLGRLDRGVVGAVAVHLLGRDAGVVAGGGDRLDGEPHVALFGELTAPAERHVADSHDGRLVAKLDHASPSGAALTSSPPRSRARRAPPRSAGRAAAPVRAPIDCEKTA